MLCELVAKGQIRRGLFDYIVDCPDMAMKAKPGSFSMFYAVGIHI